MRVHIVSDVHGAADALATAGDGADMLICLGDMLLFLDYADHTQGIFAELYGAEHAREYIALRVERRFDEARQLTAGIAARLTAERGTDLRTLTQQAISRQYAAMFGALAEPAYLTYGNVDVPPMWDGYLKPGHTVIDGGRAVVGAVSFGFAGAGLISPYRTPNEIPQLEFAAKLDAVGPVDVICTHIPPAVPELLYDTVARRMETGSTALLDMIRRTQPRYAFFGHVHNPLARRVRVGRTECVNVGHFRATRTPYAIDLDAAARSARILKVRCPRVMPLTTMGPGSSQRRPTGLITARSAERRVLVGVPKRAAPSPDWSAHAPARVTLRV